MRLYTLILEYLGGTYISQVEAESPETAATQWARQLDSKRDVEALNTEVVSEFIKELQGQEAVPIEGCRNVWCLDALVRGKLALIHVIATSIDN
ncbi:MAG: hypothetical protein ACRD2L_02070 [Terriglobia bacterium]